MAISATHFAILKELKSRGILPQGGRILEFGEANWYGDCDPKEIYAIDPAAIMSESQDGFGIAKWMYRAIFGNDVLLESIDLDPSRTARKHDLNKPFSLVGGTDLRPALFDVTYNHGTAEHIFNIAQVFHTMHDATKAGGLLIHESPFTGWVDHGFYCLQPTLFWDVAHANNYKMEFVGVEHLASRSWFEVQSREELLERRRCDLLPDNAMLFVVMRKQSSEPFKIPMQGVYCGRVSEQVQGAWRALR